jgi:hypothetical protein
MNAVIARQSETDVVGGAAVRARRGPCLSIENDIALSNLAVLAINWRGRCNQSHMEMSMHKVMQARATVGRVGEHFTHLGAQLLRASDEERCAGAPGD